MPPWINRIVRRLRALVDRSALDRDLAAEMRTHLELEAEDLARTRGLDPAEARRQAAIAFGGVQVFTEAHRDARGVRWLFELAADLRYSIRSLLRAPLFTVSATLVLALGIGAATAVFSAVDAVLLARLPYPDDARLVSIVQQNPANRWTISAVDIQAIEEARSFSAAGALRGGEVGVSAGGEAERLAAGFLTAGFLEALEVTPVAGRRLAADDERPETPATVVLSAAYASRRFGSPAAAVEQSVTIDGIPHRVVGVLAPGDARLAGRRADLWPIQKRVTPSRRGPFGMMGIARLRPGVTLDAARGELDEISRRIFPLWQAGFQDQTARLTPYSLRETVIGDATRPMALFAAAVALVLLIAVANVASLSLVRAMRRIREIALRSVLGASRARLIRLVIAESMALTLAAGGLGIAVGWAGLEVLKRLVPRIPRLDGAHLDARAVGVAVLVSLLAGLAIGLVPAVRMFAGARGRLLRDGTRAIGDGHHAGRLRGAFVALQFALALPLLSTGALLFTSIVRLQGVHPGFDPAGTFTARVSLPPPSYRDNDSRGAFWGRVAGNVSGLAGVTAVGFATATPPDDYGNNNDNFNLVDAPVPPGSAEPNATWPGVNAEFFTTLGIPLVEGRMFAAGDTASGDPGGRSPVVLVTRSWARRYFPGRSAIGRELVRGGCVACERSVIIGVVGDVTFDRLGAPGEAMFSPLTEQWPTQLNLFVRAPGAQGTIARGVHDALQAADPGAAVGAMAALEDRIYESVAEPRNWATILLGFAAAAVVMAAVGVFGLLSYAVEMRRREIGVRMALGAPARRVVRSMVAGGLRYAVAGAAVGFGLTVMVSRWLGALLFEVSPLDPLTLAGVTVGMLLVAAVASWLPARGASAIDPVQAMRPE